MKIVTSSRYLMGFINDILDMSRIEAGRMSLREDEISLPEQLSFVTAIMQSEVERKGHSVRPIWRASGTRPCGATASAFSRCCSTPQQRDYLYIRGRQYRHDAGVHETAAYAL